jgi:hypothetical protein
LRVFGHVLQHFFMEKAAFLRREALLKFRKLGEGNAAIGVGVRRFLVPQRGGLHTPAAFPPFPA